jgi:hypothetical protein
MRYDNLVRNCGTGVVAVRASSRVAEVVDAQTFVLAWGAVPMERRRSHLYKGWDLAWIGGGKPVALSAIDSFDPETLRFRIKEPRDLKVGDTFEVFPPYGANWNIHSNTITDCLSPVVLDCYGSETSLFADNIVTRGDATGVKAALELRGRFHLTGNCVSGFDEAGSAALGLYPDRFGRPLQNLCRNNTFERCSSVVSESEKGLWDALVTSDNSFLGCGAIPAPADKTAQTPQSNK